MSQLHLNNILYATVARGLVYGAGTLESERCGYFFARGVCKEEHNNKQSHINQESFQNAITHMQSKVYQFLPPEKRAS